MILISFYSSFLFFAINRLAMCCTPGLCPVYPSAPRPSLSPWSTRYVGAWVTRDYLHLHVHVHFLPFSTWTQKKLIVVEVRVHTDHVQLRMIFLTSTSHHMYDHEHYHTTGTRIIHFLYDWKMASGSLPSRFHPLRTGIFSFYWLIRLWGPLHFSDLG